MSTDDDDDRRESAADDEGWGEAAADDEGWGEAAAIERAAKEGAARDAAADHAAPDESEKANADAAPDESEKANADAAPDENNEADADAAPDESEKANADAAPGESEKPNADAAPGGDATTDGAAAAAVDETRLRADQDQADAEPTSVAGEWPVVPREWPAVPGEWPAVARVEVTGETDETGEIAATGVVGGEGSATPRAITGDESSTDWGDEPTPPPALADVERHRAPPGHVRGGGHGGGRRRLRLIGGGVLAVVLVVGGVLSWLNSRHHYLACGADRITAERGSFWPWGRTKLGGARYRPIPIPPDATCSERSFDDPSKLEDAFLAALLDRATTLLTSGDPGAIDEAEIELSQALLLTRSPRRAELRKQVEHLEGDVEYWRAAAEVQAAITALEDAAKRFDDAATRRPRHNSDAAAWAKHARRMEAEIRRGPIATRKDAPPTASGKPHFAGTGDDPASATGPAANETVTKPGTAADPVPGSESEASAAEGDAGPPPPVAPVDAAPPPADARLPRGGVLL